MESAMSSFHSSGWSIKPSLSVLIVFWGMAGLLGIACLYRLDGTVKEFFTQRRDIQPTHLGIGWIK
jgi:hypothetical protein